jgi:hypothetical protein
MAKTSEQAAPGDAIKLLFGFSFLSYPAPLSMVVSSGINMNQSEKLFEEYLEKQRIKFSMHFSVNSKNNKNVDFRLTKDSQVILCDVKEVRDSEGQPRISEERLGGRNTAQDHIRGDIKKLRDKFTSSPFVPVMLVSMNFSADPFTALTVSRALMGEIGVIFERGFEHNVSAVHHLHAGNASLRQQMNTSISGLFLFDVVDSNHCLFRSPYAKHKIQPDFFSGIKILDLCKTETQDDIIELSKLMFWNKNKG